MAPLKEKNANGRSAASATANKDKCTSPNTSRKRKSTDDNENSMESPKALEQKKAKKSPAKDASDKKKPDAKESASKAKADASAPEVVTGDSPENAKLTESLEAEAKEKEKEKPKSKTKAKASSTVSDKEKYNIDDVHLDGESQIVVPIFDTCNDIRTKINQHLRTAPKVSQASLVREFVKSYPENQLPKTGVSAVSLETFLRKKGPSAGSMPIFYAAYVYFEKLRVKQNKKKTKKREEMEEIWAKKGGMDLKADSDTPMWIMTGEKVSIDKYGVMDIF